MARRILVYGFYGKSNLGDMLFELAFKELFPSFVFTFKDEILQEDLNNHDCLFIGGGSFLNFPINTICFDKLKHFPIFYVGIGAETEIHQDHQELLTLAKLVATRSCLDKVKILNKNSILIKDIVFSLRSKISLPNKTNNSLLIIPNSEVLPNVNSLNWKQSAWNYFKSEFSQFLDELECDFKFIPLCDNKNTNDSWVAHELCSFLSKKKDDYLLTRPKSLEEITNLISSYSKIISQRYHGNILATLTNTPYISIHHHDKLKGLDSNSKKHLSFYGLNKILIQNSFSSLTREFLNIDIEEFGELKEKVTSLI